jgi:hypothetical protein
VLPIEFMQLGCCDVSQIHGLGGWVASGNHAAGLLGC